MGKYVIEKLEEDKYEVSFVDEDINDTVAITYHEIHAKIIADAFNEFHNRVLSSFAEEDEESVE